MKKFLTTLLILAALIGSVSVAIAGTYTINGQTLTWGKSRINKTLSIPGSSLQNGLVGWWTFDGTSVTSTGVVDKSGNNNTGTLVGGVTKVAGKIGQGMKFDGSTGYINGSGLSSGTNLPVTISAWIYPKGVGGRQTIFGRGATGACMGYELFLNNTILWGGGNGDFSLGGTIVNNKWQHVVAVYNGSTITGYVNGVKYLSPAGGSDTCGGTTWDVGSYNTNAYLFNGSIDDVRVYNRALSAAEVQQLYKMGGGKISKTPAPVVDPLKNGLVGWWTFDGKDVNTTQVYDKSGQSDTGKIFGGVTKVSGKIGQAFNFNGVDGYVTTTINRDFSGTVPYSVSVWFKAKNIATTQTIVGEWNATVTGNFHIYLEGGTLRSERDCNGTAISTALLSNTWYHGVMVYNGSAIQIYVNGLASGAAVNSGSSWYGDGAETTYIGMEKNLYAPWHFFNGSIDDVRIYNRVLSSQEVYQLYQQGKSWVIKK